MNDEVKGHNIEIHELSFISSHRKVSLLQDPEQLHWHYALTPDKSVATVSNPAALKKNSLCAESTYKPKSVYKT